MHAIPHGRLRFTIPQRAALPRSRRALTILGLVVIGVLVLVRIGVTASRSGTAGMPASPTAGASAVIELPPVVLAAHGVVQPAARASVGPLGAGSVADLRVEVGQLVDKADVVARLVGPGGQAELLVAPWRGTISNILLHVGDTAVPGATVFTIADLSHYQLETTDVDEYLIGRVRRGQFVTVTIDVQPARRLRGTVLTAASQTQPSAGGGTHYPVVIELGGTDPDLRPGMSAHVVFDQ